MRSIGKAWPLLIVLLLPVEAQANPLVPFPYGGAEDFGVWLTTPIAGMFVEYLAVRWFLRRQLRFRQAAPLFFRINLLTIPLTQLLGFFISVFAEVLPLTVEPVLYRRLLAKQGVEVPGLESKIIVANVWSFLFGIAWSCFLPPAITAIQHYVRVHR
jgi:hypothetical protein